MVATATKEERVFWDWVFQLDYGAIYGSKWWQKCKRGEQEGMEPADTVKWLRERPGDLPIDPHIVSGGRH